MFKQKYQITQDIIANLPQIPFRNGVGAYEGVVAHSTDNYGDTATGEKSFESTTYINAFVHYFCDDTTILQVAPTDYKAYGAGPNANPRFVHVELCQSHDATKFAEAYDRYIWLISYLLYQKGLTVVEGTTLWSHKMVTNILGGTTHEDPDGYLADHGKTWADCVNDIKVMYDECTKVEKTVVTLNQYEYLTQLAKQTDGQGAWAKEQLASSELSADDQKVWDSYNQVNYLYGLAKGDDGKATWAKNCLGTVYDSLKQQGLV